MRILRGELLEKLAMQEMNSRKEYKQDCGHQPGGDQEAGEDEGKVEPASEWLHLQISISE